MTQEAYRELAHRAVIASLRRVFDAYQGATGRTYPMTERRIIDSLDFIRPYGDGYFKIVTDNDGRLVYERRNLKFEEGREGEIAEILCTDLDYHVDLVAELVQFLREVAQILEKKAQERDREAMELLEGHREDLLVLMQACLSHGNQKEDEYNG